jgi:hypothetical protein
MKSAIIGRIASIVIMVLAVVFYVLNITNDSDAIEMDESVQAIAVDPSMYLAYIALGITAVVAILFAIYNVVTHPKQAKGVLFGIIGLAVVIGISYGIASSEPVEIAGGNMVEGSTPKLVGMGLITFYIAAGLAIAAVIVSSVSTLTKR